MSEDAVKDPEKGMKETTPNAQTSTGKESKEPSHRVSEEDLVKEIKNHDAARLLSELLRGQNIASVYIDARSGGNFFSGETNLTGDVMSGHRIHKTKFTGPTSGPIHTGSGDIHYFAATQSDGRYVELGRVLDDMRIKIQAVYVGSSRYDHARKILAEKHVVILWGQARWGKWTSAVNLLSDLSAKEIIELKPDITLKELDSIELGATSNRGYVIDTFVPDSAEKLKVHTLKALSHKLREQQSYLVITIDSRVNLLKEELSGYLTIWNEVPNRTFMLEKHLAYYLSDREGLAKVDELIQAEAVQQLLREPLLPGEVERLAELLSKVARNELNFDDALARFEARAQQQVEAWFEGHSDLEQRTFMLTLAVFNGINYDAVIAADQRLQTLTGRASTNKENAAASAFSNTRSRRIKDACAHIEKGYVETEFGRSPVDLVVLDNPTFQPAILRYAWQEYDGLHEPLLTWLNSLGLESSFDVRTRVAAAVGALSKFSFAHVRATILLPWANHEDSRVRAAAAFALGIPIWESELASQVVGLLHHWSTLPDNWRLNWTAAAAYGGLVGLRFPDAALRDLHTIALAGDLRLFGVMSRSVINLFQSGRLVPDYYFKILDALNVWAEDSKAKLIVLTSLHIFLQLAIEDRIATVEEGTTMPTLLWLAKEDEACRDKVINVWREALNNRATQAAALETLHQWVFDADKNLRIYSAVENLFRIMMAQGTDREEERLFAYLNRWANNPRQKSSSADKILSSLYNN